MPTRTRETPWDRPPPARTPKKLSTEEKNEARKRARRAGRGYPNLVDNMPVAAKAKHTGKKQTGSKRGGTGKTNRASKTEREQRA